jgi:hypothetical protein
MVYTHMRQKTQNKNYFSTTPFKIKFLGEGVEQESSF